MYLSPLACAMLKAGFPALMHVEHVSKATSHAEQTIRNKLSDDKYPIPSTLEEGRRTFSICDVANYIENVHLLINQKNTRRGRPTKLKAMLMAKQDAVPPLNIEY
ncbi:hypothetical protein ACFQ0F_06805 [Paraperlucidibaca wandonensis]|uniref:Pyocin activator protein PrtN n=1 Tax=Paraperlucidibaca wandonensis TaxID=1268273 RepID=A0ABW3HF55_9GAMM